MQEKLKKTKNLVVLKLNKIFLKIKRPQIEVFFYILSLKNYLTVPTFPVRVSTPQLWLSPFMALLNALNKITYINCL